MKKHSFRILTFLVAVSLYIPSYAQVGGSQVYSFLKLAPSARVASLGGSCIQVMDDDVSNVQQNPALLNPQMHLQLSSNWVNYLSDINFGYFGTAYSLKKYGNLQVGLQYINYGTFNGYDEYQNYTGVFKAGEQAFNLAYSKSYNKWITFGAGAKYITANYAGNRSTAIAFDAGVNCRSGDSLFDAAVVFKNFGTQIKSFTGVDGREPMPYELQAGLSFKPRHMPIRFLFTGTNLQTSSTTYINYNKPKQVSLETGEEIEPKVTASRKVFSHLTFATEFLLGKSLRLRMGLNPRMRYDLKLEDIKGMSGFSWGFGFKVKRLGFSYGGAMYTPGIVSGHFSMQINLDGYRWNLGTKK